MKVVLLAGGYGTRIRDVNENIPKPMIPIGPFFKFYHWREMYEYESKTGMYDIEILKENYLGIVMQSNWS